MTGFSPKDRLVGTEKANEGFIQDVRMVDASGGDVTTAPSTGTISTVASGIGSVTILAANTSRAGATITNTDANILYLDLSGGTASATSHSVQVAASGGYYEVPYGYTGLITGIWAADGAGSALVTEFT